MSQDHLVTCTILSFFGWLLAAFLGWSGCASLLFVIALLFLLLWVVTAVRDSKARVHANSIADTWQELPAESLSSDYEYFVPPPLESE